MSYIKYYLYKEQVSYDDGVTWDDTGNEAPSGNPVGEYETYEQCTGGTPPPTATCECSLFSASTSITVPNSGGTVTIGTFSDDCLGGFSYSFTTPTGMIASASVSGGSGVSAYTVTISPNQETTAKTGTITVSYTAGENSCTTSAISISQEAADVPKVILTLTGGTSVSLPCDGNPLTYIEINRMVGGDMGKIRTVEVKDCVTTIGELDGAGTFVDAVNMTGVTLSNTLTTIYDSTFWGCTGLTSITLPNSLTYLGNDALRYCTMTSINIPDSVQTIGGLCFFGCTNLTTVVIGTGFTTVTNPGQCFNGCVNLQSVTVKATTPPNTGSYDLFHNTNNSFIIYVPAASVNAYKSASGWSNYASRIQAIT